MASPRVSVAVVSWNTRELLRSCLRSVERAVADLEVELWVVDNGSRDGSAAMVRESFPRVRLLENPDNRGFAAAVNQVFEASPREYLLLLNSDTVVDESAVHEVLHVAEGTPRAAAFGARLVDPDGAHQPSCFRFPNLWGLALAAAGLPLAFPHSPLFNRDRYGSEDPDELREVDFVMGSFLLVRGVAFEQSGRMDEGFFLYGEEADLCDRLQNRGWKTLYVPSARVVHARGGSAIDRSTSAWVQRAKQRAILHYLAKWHGLPVAWLGNLLMLSGMIPRAILWPLADLRDLARSRAEPWPWARSCKLLVLPFHLAVLVWPRLVRRSWKRDR